MNGQSQYNQLGYQAYNQRDNYLQNNQQNYQGNYQQGQGQQQQQQQLDRKPSHRRTVDHGNNMGRWHINKLLGLTKRQQHIGTVRPESSYLMDLLPSLAYSSSMNLATDSNANNMAIMDIQTKFVHLSSNKVKHTINTVKWTPEGRRLLVASHSGEFTIWNGMTFNFETIMQAHDHPITALQYSHNDEWLLSSDLNGSIKYWQPNFNNVNIILGHASGVRDIAFSPNDTKFLTASDDSTIKIWNFNNGKEERTLSGHHWEVKSADWHPNLGLIVSGSKDNLVKLWDPRVSNCITTLHGFKHTVNKTRFQSAGTNRLLASVSRDGSCRVFDIRTMKDLLVIKDQATDLSSVSWHPMHASALTTGSYTGAINHYILDLYVPQFSSKAKNFSTFSSVGSTMTSVPSSHSSLNPEAVHRIPYAHEKAIHALEFHPLGHILCSAGSDKTARFWSRARPNDPMSYKDALYTDDKQGAWYYTVNNHINAVMEDTNVLSQLPGTLATTGTASNGSSLATPAPQGFSLPGLNNLSSDGMPGFR